MTKFITEQYGLDDYDESYVTARNPLDENYYTRSLAEDAYVSLSDMLNAEDDDDLSLHLNHNVQKDDLQTITYEQWVENQRVSTDVPTKTVKVEGEPMKVVSLNNTYWAGAIAANFFTDKDGFLRIGSVRFTTYNDTQIAQCVKCKATLTYSGAYDRESMEDFTLAVFRHGHNHSAKWVTKTPISQPVAVAIYSNDDTVDRYNEALFDQQVADAVAPAAALARLRRNAGLA